LSRRSEISTQASLIVLRDPESALSLYPYLKCDLFVIGGAKTYSAFLPYMERWIVTEVPLRVEGADTFMPDSYLQGFCQLDSKPLEEGLTVRFYERPRE
jgi:dihydrofolate reductase